MTKKKLSKTVESAQKNTGKKQEIKQKTPSKMEEFPKKEAAEKGLIQKIFGRKEAEKAPVEEVVEKKEAEKAAEPKVVVEEEIIEKSFVNREEIPEKAPSRKEGLIQKIFGRKEAEKAPVKKEEKKKVIEEVQKAPVEEVVEKKEAEKAAEPKVTSEEVSQKETIEKVEATGQEEAARVEIKEGFAGEPRKEISEAELKKKCSEVDRLWGDFTHSAGVGWKEVDKIKKEAHTKDAASSEQRERELFEKFESKRNEVRAELDELHRILGRYEERVRYKDEADGELQALEEVKVMLGEKLRNIARRAARLKVRPNSDLTKLYAEARECEEEAKRSEEDILDFEREYTKFLSMMGKMSG